VAGFTAAGPIQCNELRELGTYTAGEDVVLGTLCYFKSDGKFWKTDANAEATSKGFLALAQETISADATGIFMTKGKQIAGGVSTGSEYFISGTAGAFSSTKPSSSGDIVRLIGYALGSTSLYFDPDKTYVEVA